MPLLAVESLDAYYGDFQALFSIDFMVERGETVAIIGANGAGKSTLLRSISGLQREKRGRIMLDGVDIANEPPDQLARRGVAVVPEGRRLFPSLTVAENLMIGAAARRTGPWTLAAVYRLFPGLEPLRHQVATRISGGQQQMVAIGRALLANPRLLLCDELSLGLAPAIIGKIYACFDEISQQRRFDRDRRTGYRPRLRRVRAGVLPA